MIVMKWQIEQARKHALLHDANTLVGQRISYQFAHETAPGVNNGICGLRGYVMKVVCDEQGRPQTFDIAFDTTIDDFYVTQEDLQALAAPKQYIPGEISLVEAANYTSIVETVYGQKSH